MSPGDGTPPCVVREQPRRPYGALPYSTSGPPERITYVDGHRVDRRGRVALGVRFAAAGMGEDANYAAVHEINRRIAAEVLRIREQPAEDGDRG